MVNEKTNPRQKIIQRILIGGVILGAIASFSRVLLAFFGVLAIPSVMNVVPVGAQSNSTLLPSIVYFISTISPYLLAVGALSAFLYVYFFRNKEGRNVLIGWGILMVLHLVAISFLAWL